MYKKPDLPYDFNALEPVISAEIMELHYTKHHQGYVTNLNAALEKYAAAEAKQDLTTMIELESAIRFNGGGHINHSIFWTNLSPQGQGGEPGGILLEAIKKEFNSLENFIEKLNAKTIAIQGSGWGWLAYNKMQKRLAIVTRANQDPLGNECLIPLLGIDVWEHAYYLQYKNVRADYVKNIWKVVNWKNIQERYTAAIAQN